MGRHENKSGETRAPCTKSGRSEQNYGDKDSVRWGRSLKHADAPKVRPTSHQQHPRIGRQQRVARGGAAHAAANPTPTWTTATVKYVVNRLDASVHELLRHLLVANLEDALLPARDATKRREL
jgi:hypothetical protein